jgi:putative ABC transport system substrate-binding protein
MPDVIFAPGEQGLVAAKKATNTIPLVTVACDPLDRFIASLAAPGGTATGLTCINRELAGKRLGLLRELLPQLVRLGILYNASDPNKPREFDDLRTAGERLGLAMRGFAVADRDGIEGALRSANAEGVQAFIVLVDALMIFHRQTITDLALAVRLPTMFGFKEFVEAGGLISYGANREALFKRAAVYVDKILRGAKPGELPVEEPTIFELYLNQRTAGLLGLPIPPNLLAQADEVIE